MLAEAVYCTSQIQAVYALGRLAIFYKSSGTRHYVLLTLGSLLHFACYSFVRQQAGKVYVAAEILSGCLGLQCKHLHVSAEPTYENGELQHGGSDLDLKGSLPYYAVETIYCLALLQVLTAILSDKFWWMLLAVRGTDALEYFLRPDLHALSLS